MKANISARLADLLPPVGLHYRSLPQVGIIHYMLEVSNPTHIHVDLTPCCLTRASRIVSVALGPVKRSQRHMGYWQKDIWFYKVFPS